MKRVILITAIVSAITGVASAQMLRPPTAPSVPATANAEAPPLAKREVAMVMPGKSVTSYPAAMFDTPTPGGPEMLRLATSMLSAHADDLYIRTLYLDALIRSRKWEELTQRLTEWGTDFNEAKNKGNRKYATLGLGFRRKQLGIDVAYLVPVNKRDSPLAETLRFTLLFEVPIKEPVPE